MLLVQPSVPARMAKLGISEMATCNGDHAVVSSTHYAGLCGLIEVTSYAQAVVSFHFVVDRKYCVFSCPAVRQR